MTAALQERIDLYRQSLVEWERRRMAALAQADECLGKIHACRVAIEALESMLPAVPIEDIARAAADGSVLKIAEEQCGP